MAVTPDGCIPGCFEATTCEEAKNLGLLIGKYETQLNSFNLDFSTINKLMKRNLDNMDCNKCRWRSLCGGGCAIRAYRETGDWLGVNQSYCKIANIIYPYLIERIINNSFEGINTL